MEVTRVFYLGLPSHPNHQLAKTLLKKGFSGMLSFELRGSLEDGIKLVEVRRILTYVTKWVDKAHFYIE